MDRQEVTLLVLIDLTAAFDTIERGILQETLEKDFGIIRDARKLLASYLSHRKQRILIKNDISDAFNLGSGLPTRKLSGTGPGYSRSLTDTYPTYTVAPTTLKSIFRFGHTHRRLRMLR